MARPAGSYRAARRNAWIRRDHRDWRLGRLTVRLNTKVQIVDPDSGRVETRPAIFGYAAHQSLIRTAPPAQAAA